MLVSDFQESRRQGKRGALSGLSFGCRPQKMSTSGQTSKFGIPSPESRALHHGRPIYRVRRTEHDKHLPLNAPSMPAS